MSPYDVTRQWVNTLGPRQNGRHFADDIFKCIFLTENIWISIKISLKFVPKGPINNIPALVQIMAWRRPGDKPLSEPMMVNLPTHICVSRPQWVKKLRRLHETTQIDRLGLAQGWRLIEDIVDKMNNTNICQHNSMLKDICQQLCVLALSSQLTQWTLDKIAEILHIVCQKNFSIFWFSEHYCDVIMGEVVSQITSLAIVYSIVYSDADQRKHQSSASLAFEFPAQKASNAENVSIWWRHHDFDPSVLSDIKPALCSVMAWCRTGVKGVKIHWGQEKHICFTKLDHHWFSLWLVASLAPSHYLNQGWLIVNSTIKAPSHLDVWRERVNIVWENHQHVQKRMCVPVNHRLACSKRVSNVSKTTNHRVNTVWVTFSQRFHSVCERAPTCQTSVQRVLNDGICDASI